MASLVVPSSKLGTKPGIAEPNRPKSVGFNLHGNSPCVEKFLGKYQITSRPKEHQIELRLRPCTFDKSYKTLIAKSTIKSQNMLDAHKKRQQEARKERIIFTAKMEKTNQSFDELSNSTFSNPSKIKAVADELLEKYQQFH
jgi:hypothetical protein